LLLIAWTAFGCNDVLLKPLHSVTRSGSMISADNERDVCTDCKECLEGTRKAMFVSPNGGPSTYYHHRSPTDFMRALTLRRWICEALAAQLSAEQLQALEANGRERSAFGPSIDFSTAACTIDSNNHAVTGPTVGAFQFRTGFRSGVEEYLREISRVSQVNDICPGLYLWLQPSSCMLFVH